MRHFSNQVAPGHQQLPWLGILAMNLLNLQYWGCNQVILQRSLAARSLKDAQIGLLVQVMDQVRKAGVSNVSIAATPGE